MKTEEEEKVYTNFRNSQSEINGQWRGNYPVNEISVIYNIMYYQVKYIHSDEILKKLFVRYI